MFSKRIYKKVFFFQDAIWKIHKFQISNGLINAENFLFFSGCSMFLSYENDKIIYERKINHFYFA